MDLYYSDRMKNKKTGTDQGFQVRGAQLKKLRRTKGGAKILGVFRVKNHDFTPKNHIFSNFRGGARRVRPPLDPPLKNTTPSEQFQILTTVPNSNRITIEGSFERD